MDYFHHVLPKAKFEFELPKKNLAFGAFKWHRLTTMDSLSIARGGDGTGPWKGYCAKLLDAKTNTGVPKHCVGIQSTKQFE